MIKYILFDFDGTLANSRAVFVSVFNELARKYNFQKIDQTNIEALRELSMTRRLNYLKVPFYKLPLLTREFLFIYRQNIHSIVFMPQMKELLFHLNALGISTGILSSNSTETIKVFLKNNKIDFIKEVHCSGKIFNKQRIMQSFIRQKKLNPSEVLYVCDELRDIEASFKANMKAVWVSWGYENCPFTTIPYYKADNPGALLELIKKYCQRL